MKELILHYCDKCGFLEDVFLEEGDSSLHVCRICGGNLKTVPKEYTDFTGMIIEPNKEQDFIEKVLKAEPNFDQTAYDERIEYVETCNRQYEMLKQEQSNQPKCPYCGSTNISKIGTLNRAVSVGFLGLASSKIGKTHKCNKCGSTW